MEKLNVNHETGSISAAFAGSDKMKRIQQELINISQHSTKNQLQVSKSIQLAIELYADTTEEAIGIAIEMAAIANDYKMFMMEMMQSREEYPMRDGLASKLKNVEGTEEEIKITGLIKDHIETVNCDMCRYAENCDIQEIAKERRFI